MEALASDEKLFLFERDGCYRTEDRCEIFFEGIPMEDKFARGVNLVGRVNCCGILNILRGITRIPIFSKYQ